MFASLIYTSRNLHICMFASHANMFTHRHTFVHFTHSHTSVDGIYIHLCALHIYLHICMIRWQPCEQTYICTYTSHLHMHDTCTLTLHISHSHCTSVIKACTSQHFVQLMDHMSNILAWFMLWHILLHNLHTCFSHNIFMT